MENVTQKISYDHKIISVFGRDRLIFYWDKIKTQEFSEKFDDAIADLRIVFSRSTLLKKTTLKMEQFTKLDFRLKK